MSNSIRARDVTIDATDSFFLVFDNETAILFSRAGDFIVTDERSYSYLFRAQVSYMRVMRHREFENPRGVKLIYCLCAFANNARTSRAYNYDCCYYCYSSARARFAEL